MREELAFAEDAAASLRAGGHGVHAASEELARRFGFGWIVPASLAARYRVLADALPWHVAKRWKVLVLAQPDGAGAEGALTLVCGNPMDTDLREAIEALVPGDFVWACSDAAAIEALISAHEAQASALSGIERPADDVQDTDGQSVRLLTIEQLEREPNAVVRLVDSTLLDAVTFGASDIHVERSRAGLHIKYRVDGVLERTDAPAISTSVADQIISRVKVLADLDVTERRVPQDGSLRFRVVDRAIDVRVSILPGNFGEEAVLRILDKKSLLGRATALTLASLGLDAEAVARIRSLARRPYGMLLVTGPTGSGKSTTLYAAISEINTGRDKIITIEDPVEYELAGVLQIPVDEKKGLTFARGLRSILRHDPDRILVGEVRDRETAEIAVQAALTGHVVFSTVHANDAFDVVGRLIHMGVEPYAFMTAINGVVAQRLVRRVCAACRNVLAASTGTSATPAHCPVCRGTGYRGRIALAEVLELDDELRSMVVERRPLAEAKRYAQKRGLVGLRMKALALVEQGLTTLEEVDRVTVADA